MNTILIRIKRLIILISMCLIMNEASAADSNDPYFYIRAGGSFSMLLNKLDFSKSGNNNFSPSIGFYWSGGKLLSIGIDASYLRIISEKQSNVSTEFGPTNYQAEIYSMPVSLMFIMQINSFKAFGGGGLAILNSNIEAFGQSAFSYRISPHYVFGVAYKIYDYRNISLDIESKTFIIPEIYKNLSSIGLEIEYHFKNSVESKN